MKINKIIVIFSIIMALMIPMLIFGFVIPSMAILLPFAYFVVAANSPKLKLFEPDWVQWTILAFFVIASLCCGIWVFLLSCFYVITAAYAYHYWLSTELPHE